MAPTGEDDEAARGVTRRAWLGYASAAAGGVVLGAGGTAAGFALAGDSDRDGDSAGSEESSDAPDAGAASGTAEPSDPEPRRYLSNQLVAPDVSVETTGAVAAGLLFTGGRMSVFQGAILDNDGEPVWLEPDGRGVADLKVQTYRGRPVLTYWAGNVFEGWGTGQGVILDDRYREVATVRTGHGVAADLHEFTLTDRGTALLVSYPTIPFDLTPVGGPAQGWLLSNRVQEVDVETGEVLLDWVAEERLDLTETHEKPGGTRPGDSPAGAFDAWHVNSVQARGNALLLGFRHSSSLVLVDRRSGEVRWRLGGERSDFEVAEDAHFGYQHDARFLDGGADGTTVTGRLSVFDNNGRIGTTGRSSSGLLLDVDESARTVRLVRRYTRGDRFSGAMGSMQVLDDSHVLVGWGTDPSATEFTPDGQVVQEVTGLAGGSYRVYRHRWTGRPDSAPDVAAALDEAGLTVHASWNGATGVARWRVLGADDPDRLRPLSTGKRTGFETTLTAKPVEHVAVAALDARGRELGRSRTVRVRRPR
ncbi:arylsulfotransferase family protein [Nocardioides houyundeii]|uniref:arylsulfotransferase family protein n=1 Tax=Nocardioides houyundeii TaxID=2045452 RepID=UPI000C786235|nr:arylsulfotransferase family protein [Nocardioides houyundeii]